MYVVCNYLYLDIYARWHSNHCICLCMYIGMVYKRDHESPWVLFDKGEDSSGREEYKIIAALPPYPTPTRTEVSDLFT